MAEPRRARLSDYKSPERKYENIGGWFYKNIGNRLQTVGAAAKHWVDTCDEKSAPRNVEKLKKILNVHWVFLLGVDVYPKYQTGSLIHEGLTKQDIEHILKQIQNVCCEIRGVIPELIFPNVLEKQAFVREIGGLIDEYAQIYLELEKKLDEMDAAEEAKISSYERPLPSDYSSAKRQKKSEELRQEQASSRYFPIDFGYQSNTNWFMYYLGTRDQSRGDSNELLWWCDPSYRSGCVDVQLTEFFFSDMFKINCAVDRTLIDRTKDLAEFLSKAGTNVGKVGSKGYKLWLQQEHSAFKFLEVTAQQAAELTQKAGEDAINLFKVGVEDISSATSFITTRMVDLSSESASSAISFGKQAIEGLTHFGTTIGQATHAGLNGAADFLAPVGDSFISGAQAVGHAVGGAASGCGGDCDCRGCGECCGGITVAGGGAGGVGGPVIAAAASGGSGDATSGGGGDNGLTSGLHHGSVHSTSSITSHAAWSKFFAFSWGSLGTLIYTVLLLPPYLYNNVKDIGKACKNIYNLAKAKPTEQQKKQTAKRNIFAASADFIFSNGFGVAGFIIGMVIPFGGPHTAIALGLLFAYLGRKLIQHVRKVRMERKQMGDVSKALKHAPRREQIDKLANEMVLATAPQPGAFSPTDPFPDSGSISSPPSISPASSTESGYSGTDEKSQGALGIGDEKNPSPMTTAKLFAVSQKAQEVYSAVQQEKQKSKDKQQVLKNLKPSNFQPKKALVGAVTSYTSMFGDSYQKSEAQKEASKDTAVFNGTDPTKNWYSLRLGAEGG